MEVMYRKGYGLIKRHFWPRNWPERTWRVLAVAFFAIALPIYVFIGFQPATDAEAKNYPQLEISSIGLQTPVKNLELVDHQLETPASIAGSYSQNPHKTLLIGHSSTVFSNLQNVQLADSIVYDENSYNITRIETVAKENIDMADILAATDRETVVIMTCAGEPLPDQDATHRLIVYATKTTL